MLPRSLSLLLVVLLAACSKPPETAATKPAEETSAATSPADGYTFGVFGGNRNEGSDPPAFEQIVNNLAADRPAMVLHTGDIIYGDIGDEANMHLRWRAFRHYVAPLRVPVHLPPGNHDIFNPVSARVWKEEVGETYNAFDEGGCRFIALDHATHGKSALDISLDPQSPAAVLYAALDPAWNLSSVHTVALDIVVPDPAITSDFTLVLLHDHLTYPAAPIALKPGPNHLTIPLDPAWLPDSARANIEEIRLMLSTAKPGDAKSARDKTRHHIILGNLHVE